MNLLDEIVTDNDTYYGVVDYSNKKHIVFFDTTKNNSPDIILLVISWRCTYADTMRFSIFRDIFFPHVDIPIILIPRKNVVNLENIESMTPSIQKRTIKKKLTPASSC